MHLDDDVVHRAKGGDPDAWGELYRLHAGRLVVWLSTRPTGDCSVHAEDLAADTWLTAAQKVGDFTGSADEFAGWLFGIARKLSANTRRRTLRRATSPTAEPPARVGSEGHESVVVGHHWVMQALAQLPPRERDVIACLEVVGLDVEGTARALGITPVATRVARHRGLRRLRRTMIVQGSPEPGSPGQPGPGRAALECGKRDEAAYEVPG
ncbi:RNA polymerase sigma factor [Nocardioides sp.]|uniref:RNA polymerase sigma factor n=1 Tax=Nocardioides sp. TaxID=35761 RepID=UPI0035670EA0